MNLAVIMHLVESAEVSLNKEILEAFWVNVW